MAPSIDPSILRALSLDASATHMATHGGSGFSSTYRLNTHDTTIFVKTAPGAGARVMFEGEHASLNAIHEVVPSLCPRALAWGELDSGGGYFLATEFLELGSGLNKVSGKTKGRGSGMSLAQKLAKLHTTPAPIPAGQRELQYGFPVTTCCGDSPQLNGYKLSWPEFFANNRLLAVLELGEKKNGKDEELRRVVERAARDIVPRLLREGHLGGKEGIVPVVVHGDLWSGNHGRGTFVGRGDNETGEVGAVEEVIYDPSASYSHSEFDFGIMRMFGFDGKFLTEYHSLVSKTKPVDEYEDRVKLYESYHHLNHWAIFGGGYRSGAMSILRGLAKKYGEKA